MKGVMKICKDFGQITLGSSVWLWDYDKDMAVNTDILNEASINRIRKSRREYMKSLKN